MQKFMCMKSVKQRGETVSKINQSLLHEKKTQGAAHPKIDKNARISLRKAMICVVMLKIE